MDAKNCAIVLAPNILKPRADLPTKLILNEMNKANVCIQDLIMYYPQIFTEGPPQVRERERP